MDEFYQIDPSVSKLSYDELSTQKFKNTAGVDCLLISLEKGSELPAHNSPKDVNIYLIEGSVIFKINNTEYCLKSQDWFRFPKGEVHSAIALENTKFFVLRS